MTPEQLEFYFAKKAQQLEFDFTEKVPPEDKIRPLSKAEKAIILEEILELVEGKKPSKALIKLLRWLEQGSA